jgi:hypothetical protein
MLLKRVDRNGIYRHIVSLATGLVISEDVGERSFVNVSGPCPSALQWPACAEIQGFLTASAPIPLPIWPSILGPVDSEGLRKLASEWWK